MEKFQEVLQAKPHVLLGKSGITPGVLEHISAQLKQQQILKLKIHPDIAKEKGRDTIIEEIMHGLRVYILDVRGFTFIISKKKIMDIHLPKKFLEIYSNLPPKQRSKRRTSSETLQSTTPKLVIPSEVEPDFSSKPEPEFIDYDDENLVARIDQQSDDLYGAVKSPHSLPKPKKKRSPRLDNKKPKKFVRKNAKKLRKKRKKKSDSADSATASEVASETATSPRKKYSYTGKRRKGPNRPARKKTGR